MCVVIVVNAQVILFFLPVGPHDHNRETRVGASDKLGNRKAILSFELAELLWIA